VLISGDQITAGVQFLLDRANPLADHFQSLTRLRGMDVKLVLPGHGSPFVDHRKRIDHLRAHFHDRRVLCPGTTGCSSDAIYQAAASRSLL
jgi:glyoxylase-like metal-dependent hydrolase (beta-lactamase superfamily II)